MSRIWSQKNQNLNINNKMFYAQKRFHVCRRRVSNSDPPGDRSRRSHNATTTHIYKSGITTILLYKWISYFDRNINKFCATKYIKKKKKNYRNSSFEFQVSRKSHPHWTMRFPNMYDTASTPGIETGPTAWELSIIPRRHNDIHFKRPELQLFMQQIQNKQK